MCITVLYAGLLACDQSMCISFCSLQVELTTDVAAHCDSLQSGHYNGGGFLSGGGPV